MTSLVREINKYCPYLYGGKGHYHGTVSINNDLKECILCKKTMPRKFILFKCINVHDNSKGSF